MDAQGRDMNLFKIAAEGAAKCANCEDDLARQVYALGYDNTLRHQLCGAVKSVNASREEQIVMGIVALVRSSRLPRSVVLGAAISYLDEENSDHKNHNCKSWPSL